MRTFIGILLFIVAITVAGMAVDTASDASASFVVRVVSAPVTFARAFVRVFTLEKELADVRMVNADLRAQMIELSHVSVATLRNGRHTINAYAYTEFPFTNRALVRITVGARDGVASGAMVTVGDHYLFGVVRDVDEVSSVIQTIFDPAWELPVRVGSSSVEGLLVGGPTPRVTLIEAKRSVRAGDSVFSVTSAFPYGMNIGQVESVASPNSTFQEAVVALPYRERDVAEVFVSLE